MRFILSVIAVCLVLITAKLYIPEANAEVAGMEGDKPRLNAIWKYNAATDRIEETGIPSKMRETICIFSAHCSTILLDLSSCACAP